MSVDFFSRTEIQELIRKTINSLLPPEESNKHLLAMLNFCYDNYEICDLVCTDSIEQFEQRIISALNHVCTNQHDKLHNHLLFEFLYRIICELEFKRPKSINSDPKRIKNSILSEIDNLPPELKSAVIYDSYSLPTAWVSKILSSKEFKDATTLILDIKNFENISKRYLTEIEDYKNQAFTLKSSLEEYKTGFNFVGLYKGFHDLKVQKATSLKLNQLGMFVFGATLIIAIACNLILSPELNLKTIPKIITAIAFDVVIAYYFRIFLLNYNQLKSEILQIDLRMTLCQFIQSYADFAKEIHAKTPSSLEKFESLIFSSLTDGKIQPPSSFEGLDHMAKIIDALRQK